jgi:hypothetical protein
MTLDDFIRDKPLCHAYGYVDFENRFEVLQVGLRPIVINGKRYTDVIRIRFIVAKEPGSGNFRRLIKHLKEVFPDHLIVVEEVNPTFAAGILRMGGIQINDYLAPNYVLNLKEDKINAD